MFFGGLGKKGKFIRKSPIQCQESSLYTTKMSGPYAKSTGPLHITLARHGRQYSRSIQRFRKTIRSWCVQWRGPYHTAQSNSQWSHQGIQSQTARLSVSTGRRSNCIIYISEWSRLFKLVWALLCLEGNPSRLKVRCILRSEIFNNFCPALRKIAGNCFRLMCLFTCGYSRQTYVLYSLHTSWQ